jgi:hypothetical protein
MEILLKFVRGVLFKSDVILNIPSLKNILQNNIIIYQ